MHVCLLPSQAIRPWGAHATPVPELIASPFEFGRWDSLWRMTAALQDRPGLVHDIVHVLQTYDVGVLTSESGTSQENRLHLLEMFLDIPQGERVPFVEVGLLTKLFSDVAFAPDGRHRLRIRRVQTLWQAKRAYEQLKLGLATTATNNATFLPLAETAEVQDIRRAPNGPPQLRLRIPHSIRKVLRECVSEPIVGRKRPDWGYQVRLSDTKDRYLRVVFLRSSEPVIHARIEYESKPGAMSDITGALVLAGFDMLSEFSAPVSDRRRRLEVVLRAEVASTGNETRAIKRRLEEALTSVPPDVAVEIGYPIAYKRPWKKGRKIVARATEPPPRPEPHQIKEILDSHHAVLHKELQNQGLVGDSLNRWGLLNELSVNYERLTLSSRPKTLFISSHYVGDQLTVLRQEAERAGFRVVTGENLLSDPDHRSGLVRKIRSCSHYLGFWSSTGAVQCGSEYWPSPWLLWEAGVAAACGLTARFLIANQITDAAWKKVWPAQQHIRYSETDFHAKLLQALDTLKRLPASHMPAGQP